MPNKYADFMKAQENLEEALRIITDSDKCDETEDYLWTAYEAWCRTDQYAYKENEAVIKLYDLHENLNTYQKDGDFNMLEEHLSEIKSILEKEMENYFRYVEKSDDSSNVSSDEEESSNENTDDLSADEKEEKNEKPTVTILEAPRSVYGKYCSLQHTRTAVKQAKSQQHHHAADYQEMHAELRKTSKKGHVKYQFNPAPIHHQQRITVNHQRNNQVM